MIVDEKLNENREEEPEWFAMSATFGRELKAKTFLEEQSVTCFVPMRYEIVKDRKEDIPLLVNHFIQLICAEQGWKDKCINNEAIQALQQHHWPGNIRELRNVVEYAFNMAAGEEITVRDIPESLLYDS